MLSDSIYEALEQTKLIYGRKLNSGFVEWIGGRNLLGKVMDNHSRANKQHSMLYVVI